jgi:hypothetical protein
MSTRNLITAIAAAGTWLAVLVALFGQSFWQWIRRPQLRVELLNNDGDLEVETVSWADAAGAVRVRTRETRYYRVCVSNAQRAGTVQDVLIVVDAIERELPNGQAELEYRGPIPLLWQHPDAFPKSRSVGTSAVADFLVVSEEQTLRLATAIPRKEYALRTSFWVTVAARGREADSPPVRFKISWDGVWERGAAEMRAHLTIDVEQRPRFEYL